VHRVGGLTFFLSFQCNALSEAGAMSRSRHTPVVLQDPKSVQHGGELMHVKQKMIDNFCRPALFLGSANKMLLDCE
jgi:hypothetical protein